VFEVRGVGGAGAPGPVTTRAFTLDVTPPAPTLGGAPPAVTAATGATLTLAAARAAKFECSLDGAPFAQCPAEVAIAGLAHGDHVFRARAINSQGTRGEPTALRWSVDLVGPSIATLTGPGSVSLDGTAAFAPVADEDGARLRCRLDSGAWELCTSPKSYEGLADGNHTFAAAAVDSLGNVGAVRTLGFEVRTTPEAPVITSGPGPGATVPAPPGFGFSARYAVDYECRLDDAPFTACEESGVALGSDLADGPHVFEVRGVGGAGAPGPVTTRAFTLDVTPPELAIVRIRSRSANGASFRFPVSDPAGVAAIECRLDRQDWRACHSPQRFARLEPGRHRLHARIADSVGNVATASTHWRLSG
jgi:hypothetical protein